MLYVAKVHLNYSKEEFWNSTFKEIVDMWELHCKFNGWTNKENNTNNYTKYKKVNIEDLNFI